MTETKQASPCRPGGCAGAHRVKQLKSGRYWPRGVDSQKGEYYSSCANGPVVGNLGDIASWRDGLDDRMEEACRSAAWVGEFGSFINEEAGCRESMQRHL